MTASIAVLICLVVSLVLALLAAFNVPSSRVGLGWLSFAFFVMAEILRVIP